MKAVMSPVPPDLLAWRKKRGLDRWDEMWEGVLHMVAAPTSEHQDLEGAMETWLRIHWARPFGGRVYHQVNVAAPGGWPDSYRIPDLVLLTPERFHIDKSLYFEGAPEVVVEIRSPEDETYDKLPFYASLEVPEVWVVDRDTREPELYTLEGGYRRLNPDAEGWLVSRTGVGLRGEGGRLVMRLGEDEATREALP
ncbi:MAG TPA: Uma2 family endonuclease [Candidatus Nitrosotenuis sp.]|nr:Uma2 family endonuclease [Candidatus Nitrosotenuis sp.]